MSSSRSSKTAPSPTTCVGDGTGRSSGVWTWKLKKILEGGVIAKREKVEIWLGVTIRNVLLRGFTWSVYKWLKLLKENGTALHAMQLAQIRKQKSNRL